MTEVTDEIRKTDWNVLKHNDVSTYVENVTDCITELTRNHVLNRAIICRPSDPAWLTAHIRKLIRKRKRPFNKFLKNKKCQQL